MSSGDDDDISRESASEASDNDRSARFSSGDDDHSPSQYKKLHRDEEEERDFEKDHCRFIETDQPPEVDPDSIGMMKID